MIRKHHAPLDGQHTAWQRAHDSHAQAACVDAEMVARNVSLLDDAERTRALYQMMPAERRLVVAALERGVHHDPAPAVPGYDCTEETAP